MRFLLCLLPLMLLAQPASEPARVTHAGLLAVHGDTWLSDMAIDGAGNVYLSGHTVAADFPATQRAHLAANSLDTVVVKFDPLLSKVLYATRIGGSGHDYGSHVAVDSAGAVYVTGLSNSDELPVSPAGFGAQFNPNLMNLVSKLNPDGSLAWMGYLLTSDTRDIAVDPEDRPWLIGGDTQRYLATTSDAIQGANAGGICFAWPNAMGGLNFARCPDAFLARIAPDGSEIEYATYLGGAGGEFPQTIVGPDGHTVVRGSDSARSIAFGTDGSIFLAGFTTSPGFPVTTGAFQEEIRAGDGFLAKLSPDGGDVEWATFLGTKENDAAFRVAAGPGGALTVLGGTGDASRGGSDSGVGLKPWGSWMVRLTADGSHQEWLTRLPMARSLMLTEDGAAYASLYHGDTSFSDAFAGGKNLLVGVNGRGNVMGSPASMYGLGGLLAYHGQGVFYMAGVNRHFAGAAATAVQTVIGSGDGGIGAARIIGTAGEPGYIERIENAASRLYAPIGARPRLSPGEAFTIMGDALGPEPGVVGQADESGFLPTELSGMRVLLDDVALPLYYVSAGQINTFAPFGLTDEKWARLVIEREGRRFGYRDVAVVPVTPGVFTDNFTGRGQVVMDNEDGSLNTWENPAPGGSVVTFFATGLGATEPAMEDGRVSAEETAAALRAEVSVSMGDLPAELVSVDPAPGHAAGVWRIRARVPVGLAASGGHWVYVHAGDGVRSQPFATIAVE